MNNNDSSDTILSRKREEKRRLVEQLEKTPIVQVACEKAWVGRATYYRWMKDDKEFAQQAKTAHHRGILLMNDYAESQLLKSVKDGNMTAIIFWLKSRHSAYWSKLELSMVSESEDLTDEEQKTVERILKQYRHA